MATAHPPRAIAYWNSRTQRMEEEAIFGEAPLRWLYGSVPGRALSFGLLRGKWFSRAYGAYQSSGLSARQIARFVQDYRIPMEEFEPGPFASFNDFFIRRFKPGMREFPKDPHAFGAPAEARYLAFDRLLPETRFPVKGIALSAAEVLASAEKAASFAGGPAWIARLCPVDYHRYHYPDAGRTLDAYPVRGALHSVNPVALTCKPDILITNERRVSILETENFGRLALVEVGAMSVGKICQTWDENQPFKRGAEKGYFLFGGSTTIVLGQPGAWNVDPEMVARSRAGTETWVPLGGPLARMGG